jgi:hypothetical protein
MTDWQAAVRMSAFFSTLCSALMIPLIAIFGRVWENVPNTWNRTLELSLSPDPIKKLINKNIVIIRQSGPHATQGSSVRIIFIPIRPYAGESGKRKHKKKVNHDIYTCMYMADIYAAWVFCLYIHTSKPITKEIEIKKEINRTKIIISYLLFGNLSVVEVEVLGKESDHIHTCTCIYALANI